MNNFIYDIPVRVYFGENQLCHLGEELSKYGKRVLLTYGGGSIKRSGLYDAVTEEIKNAGLELYELSGIAPNPRIDSVRDGARMCKEHHIDVLLAVGGGVISNPETQDKIGRLSDPLLPKASFLDPTLTYSVSPYQTACGAADMMSYKGAFITGSTVLIDGGATASYFYGPLKPQK